MAEIAAPESLQRPINVPHKLLMGPGPSNVSPRVLAAGALPLLGHLHPEFCKIMDEVKEGIRYAFQTKNRLTVAVSGTGHCAMEAACCNIVEAGDTILVACAGLWGERFAEMAKRQDANVKRIVKPQGEVFSREDIEQGLSTHRPVALFLTHGESSSATLQPIEDLGHLCHRYNCLLVVDTVAAMGGVPLYMDKWGIDVLYTGAQKVLSAPPGASPISFSDRAWTKIARRKTPVRSFYTDMNCLANYWGCDGQPRKYHHTAPISSVYALREALAVLAEEGLENSWRRHQECADLFHRHLKDMGLELAVKKKANRLPTVTAISVPPGVNWKNVADYIVQKYRVEISGGLGPSAGKVWRVGLMGYNATPHNVRLVLRVLKEAIDVERKVLPAKL